MSSEDIKPNTPSTTLTVSVPGGKDGMKTLTASLGQLVAGLPIEVQHYLFGKPGDVHRILGGEIITGTKSTGAGEVAFRVSKNGYDVLDAIRDS